MTRLEQIIKNQDKSLQQKRRELRDKAKDEAHKRKKQVSSGSYDNCDNYDYA
jgi:hypothetical protein